MPTFGQQLRRVRRKLGISQKELAHRLGHTGNSTVSGWERLLTPPAPDSVRRIARALQLPVSDLLEHVPTKYDDDDDASAILFLYQRLTDTQRATVRDLLHQLTDHATRKESGA